MNRYTHDLEARERVASFIETHRTAGNLTQEQLAAGVGVTRRTISNWESGDVLPKLPDMVRVIEFLGEDAGNFFSEVFGEKKPNLKQEKVVSLIRSMQDEAMLDLLYDFISGLNQRKTA